MKINEVFAKLIENQKDVYECFSDSKKYELSVSDNGYFLLKTTYQGSELSQSSGGGGFCGNIKFDSDWKLVKEAVDFMTAINSDKRIRPEEYPGFCTVNYWFQHGFVTLESVKGKWYIE